MLAHSRACESVLDPLNLAPGDSYGSGLRDFGVALHCARALNNAL